MDPLNWRVVALAAAMTLGSVTSADQSLETPDAGGSETRLAVYNKPQITLHTDLPSEHAASALAEIERTLEFAARHWRRPARGKFECYVASNVANWPDRALPHPLARVWIGGVGGATVTETAESRRSDRKKATVYASTLPGVLAHEVIHAYCLQTFGTTGPEWYKEGIAEVVAYGLGQGKRVCCPPEVIKTLRGSPRRLQQIVQAGEFTHDMQHTLGVMLANRVDAALHVPLSDWTHGDVQQLDRLRESYHWSWALCHFLLHNPNYAHRFRRLEEGYLTGGRESFQQVFGPMLEELVFEFAQFVKHVEVGYRVDLCRWDWDKRFRRLDRDDAVTRRIQAKGGYQATGLKVDVGQLYRFEARGEWTVAPGHLTNADGHGDGRGTLVAVVLTRGELTKPFELGIRGKWIVPESGRLYVRCRDAWNELTDNTGSVCVDFERTR